MALHILASLLAGQAEPPPTPDPCLDPPGFNLTSFSTDIFSQGATIGIRAQRDVGPLGVRDHDPLCLSRWSIEGPAMLATDHGSLTIRPDAPAGAEIVLRYQVGSEPVLARLRVEARDLVPLGGRWSQTAAAGCEALEPVRELEFGRDRFSVTFIPFETYNDYWGRYSYDPRTGALRLTVENGNNVPGGLDLEGTARIEDGHLVLEGLFLGDRYGGVPEHGCRYRF